jgi:hypothetical protein
MTVTNEYGWTRVGMVWVPPSDDVRPADDRDAPRHRYDWSGVIPRTAPDPVDAEGRDRPICGWCGKHMMATSTTCRDCQLDADLFDLEPRELSPTALRLQQRKARREERLWEKLTETLRGPAPDLSPLPPGRPCCPDCGCMLLNERELCPNCVIPWIRAAADNGNLDTYQHQPTATTTATTTIQEIAA